MARGPAQVARATAVPGAFQRALVKTFGAALTGQEAAFIDLSWEEIMILATVMRHLAKMDAVGAEGFSRGGSPVPDSWSGLLFPDSA